MLGADYTLRSNHLFFLLLIGSSVILGFAYINEIYQRFRLQTDVTLVQRQTQQALSEKSTMRHKAGQLQLKLEALTNEMKRLQDIHEFQAQQQSTHFVKEKNELLEKISEKDEEITDLREQNEGLKERFDKLHSVIELFEKNQSSLLEKFTTQSTKCMNVISMMTALCDKGKDKFRKILPLVKEENALVDAVKNQSNISVKESDQVTKSTSPKTPKPVTPNTTPLGGTQTLTDLKLEVNNSEQHKTVNLKNIQSKDSTFDMKEQKLYRNITKHDNKTSPNEAPVLTSQDGSIQIEEYDTVVREKDLNTSQTANAEKSKQQRLNQSLDKNLQALKEKFSSFQDDKEGEGNLHQLASASNTTTDNIINNVIKESENTKLNNKPSEEKNKKEETLKMNKDNTDSGKDGNSKDEKETLQEKVQNMLISQNDVYNTETGKDKNTRNEKETLQEEVQNMLISQNDVYNTETGKDKNTTNEKETLQEEVQNMLSSQNDVYNTETGKDKNTKKEKETLQEDVENALSSQNDVHNAESDKDGNAKDKKETFEEDMQNALSSQNDVHNAESDKDGKSKDKKEPLNEGMKNALSLQNDVYIAESDKDGKSKDTNETLKEDMKNALSSQNDVHNAESDKDIKYKNIILKPFKKTNDEKKL